MFKVVKLKRTAVELLITTFTIVLTMGNFCIPYAHAFDYHSVRLSIEVNNIDLSMGGKKRSLLLGNTLFLNSLQENYSSSLSLFSANKSNELLKNLGTKSYPSSFSISWDDSLFAKLKSSTKNKDSLTTKHLEPKSPTAAFFIGLLGLILPSSGAAHVYAEDYLTASILAASKITGTGMIAYGVATGMKTGKPEEIYITIGAILWFGSAVYDTIFAPIATEKWNRKHGFSKEKK